MQLAAGRSVGKAPQHQQKKHTGGNGNVDGCLSVSRNNKSEARRRSVTVVREKNNNLASDTERELISKTGSGIYPHRFQGCVFNSHIPLTKT